MADYELSLQQAIRQTFSDKVIIKGCWFHFCQAILRRIEFLGLKNLYLNDSDFRFWVKQFMALALIPIEKLQSGIDIIITNQLSAKQIDFVKYFVRQWCNAKRSKQCPAIWNQHMAVRRTNNVLEGYHSMMTSCMRRVHPSVSEVIEFFKNRLSVSS